MVAASVNSFIKQSNFFPDTLKSGLDPSLINRFYSEK